MKTFDSAAARAALAASPQGQQILALAEAKDCPVDIALDLAYEGRIGKEVAAYAATLPDFLVKGPESPMAAATRLYDAAEDAAVKAMDAEAAKHASRCQSWVTNESSGVDVPEDSRAALKAAQAELLRRLAPYTEGTGRKVNPYGRLCWLSSLRAAMGLRRVD
jgi:hypothetical protein